MDKLKGLSKGGWHPPGDIKVSRDSWKSDLKGIASGKKKDPYEEQRNHTSTPLTTLKDPDSFGPPPKHSAYYGSGQTAAGTQSDQSGWGAVTASSSKPTHQQQQEQARQEEEEEEARPRSPPGPFRKDTTGLRTDNLPKPPIRRTESPASGSASPTRSRPVPSLPPRVPPRQATGGPPPPLRQATGGPPPPPPPRQNEYPDEFTPAPPPAYGEAVQRPPHVSVINTAAANRLAQAGVSVPGFGIGANATPPESPSAKGHPTQVNELQQRFARMSNRETQQPAAAQAQGQVPDTRPAWQQQMACPGSSGFASRQAEASPPATPTSPVGKKPPPPPPPKKSGLSSGSAPTPPPLPLASKPRPG